jgi:ribosomal protein S12 methylthiotransferase accessory factor YcaO
MPVCMVVMYNQDSQILYYRMGAAPVFDIAVERCFTELYQGWNVLPNDENVFMAPYEAQYT